MTTNQTIDGVPRELLEVFAGPRNYTPTQMRMAMYELRALLDADECCHEFVPFQANCTKCGLPYKPAAQPQGEPVAWQRKSHMEDARWFDLPADNVSEAIAGGYRVRALYAEQPAPVAVVLPERYDESQYRGTSLLAVRRWNACLDEVTRLNATGRIPERLNHSDGLHTYEYVKGYNDAIDKMLGTK